MQDKFCITHRDCVFLSYRVNKRLGRFSCKLLCTSLICLFVPLACNVRECGINFVGVIQSVAGKHKQICEERMNLTGAGLPHIGLKI
jgi:hypothetical protein